MSLRDVRHVYRAGRLRGPAVDIARLDVESRSHMCLVGSSGSGKTTLLNILAGILVPSSGHVYLGETDLFALSEAERDMVRSRQIGCVFQTLNLLQGLSALENLTLAQRFAGISQAHATRRGRELLDLLDLSDRADARPNELSMGEQQRVAIARAVSKHPSLVLADEPTASLDDDNAEAAIELLLGACTESTLIVVTHDARVMAKFDAVCPLGSLARSPETHS